MLSDLLNELATAKDKKAKEVAYRRLEKVGMDRRTAMVLVNELRSCIEENNLGKSRKIP